MNNYDQMVDDGKELGFIEVHDGESRWLEVRFPDGSWEVIPASRPKDKHVAVVKHAHDRWKQAAWDRTKRVYGKRGEV